MLVTDTQKRDDITVMDAKVCQPFSMNMMIEGYFQNMTFAWYARASLGHALADAKIIQIC